MSEEEIEKMVKDPVVGMNQWCVTYDFSSLYPSTMTMNFPSKQSRRKNKIKKIFSL